jgi:hypothetical protein
MRSTHNHAVEEAKAPVPQSFAEIAKNDFILIGAALLYLGLVSTDAYYRSFGLRFQFLSYPWNLIVFRGILTVVRFPILWLPIAFIVVALQIDRALIAKGRFGRQYLRMASLYLLSAGFIWWMTNAATSIGLKEATSDMFWETTTLPHINRLVNSSSVEEKCPHCVLLMMDSSQVTYFTALDKGDTNDLPDTQVRARSTINSLSTSR